MQNDVIPDILDAEKNQETKNSPSLKKQLKVSRKHLMVGACAVAVATAIVMVVPSGKPANQNASVAAANQAENTSQANQADGYKITTSNNTTPTAAASGGVSANSSTYNNNNGSTVSEGSVITAENPQPASAISSIATPPPSAALEGAGQLNSISAQLQSIQDALNTNGADGSVKEIKGIKTQLNSVLFQVKGMILESSDNVDQTIQSSSQALASQLSDMKGQLSNIQQLSQPGGYIDPSNLPFTVQFIDSVSGQNVVTVSYNNLLTPLSVGESLAGWTLTSADYASQYAVFQNAKDQLVKAGNNAAIGQGE